MDALKPWSANSLRDAMHKSVTPNYRGNTETMSSFNSWSKIVVPLLVIGLNGLYNTLNVPDGQLQLTVVIAARRMSGVECEN